MPCNVALTATFKSISRGALNSSPPPLLTALLFLRHTHTQKKTYFGRLRCKDIANSNVNTTVYPHTCTYTHCYTVNYPAPSLSALSSYPSSCLHPAPRDNSLPFGQAGRQAVEGTAMDMFCLLSNERRNVTVGLSAGPSQPSIHTCGISTVYQTAGRQLCSLFLSLAFFLSQSLSASFSQSPSVFLQLYSMCLSLSISDHKRAEAQVCLAGTPRLASPSPNIVDLT